MKFKDIIIILLMTIGCNLTFAQKMTRACLKSNNDITVEWEKLKDTCIKFIKYELYGKEDELASFKLLYTEILNEKTTFLFINGGSISSKWQFYIKATKNCMGFDEVLYDTVTIDNEPPQNIDIDTVSIVNGVINIGWQKSNSNDVKGYIVYYVDSDNKNIPIGSNYGKNNTLFIDTNNKNIDVKSYKYRIVAFDSCDNYSNISAEHVTMLLSSKVNFCNLSVELEWTHYLSWVPTEREYEIVISDSHGIINSIIVDGSINKYVIDFLKNKENYFFTIRAKNKKTNYTSSSNVLKVLTEFVENPKEIYLSNVTTVGSDILVNWVINEESDIDYFILYREYNDVLKKFNLDYQGNIEYAYLDVDVLNDNVYKYYVSAINTCGTEIIFSNKSSNIVLKIIENNNVYGLKWNNYENWLSTRTNSLIYQKDEDTNLWIKYKEANKDLNNIENFIFKNEIEGYNKCYYLLQSEESINKFNLIKESKSNEVCIEGGQIVFIPNSINLSSEVISNRVFKPAGKNIDEAKSTITIFNRWGELVVYLNNIFEGWNGINSRGDLVEDGVYYYIIKIYGTKGDFKKYTGTIHVFK